MKEELNLQCPYKVTADTESSTYYFTTKNNIKYSLAFSDAVGYFDSATDAENVRKIYSLNLEKLTDGIEPFDYNVSLNIKSIVEHFFRDKENSLVYLCDPSDKKDIKRSRLFERWFSGSEFKKNLIKLDEEIVSLDDDENPTVHYTSLIYHKDNPFESSLNSVYYEFIESLKK